MLMVVKRYVIHAILAQPRLWFTIGIIRDGIFKNLYYTLIYLNFFFKFFCSFKILIIFFIISISLPDW